MLGAVIDQQAYILLGYSTGYPGDENVSSPRTTQPLNLFIMLNQDVIYPSPTYPTNHPPVHATNKDR